MQKYLSTTGIKISNTAELNTIVKDVLKEKPPILTKAKVEALYTYDVPQIIEGGGCGLKAKDPYRLKKTLQLKSEKLAEDPNTLRLYRLNQIVNELQKITKLDWLGIYRRTKNLEGEDILLKEAYYGKFSRAEFKLTTDFAKESNNSTVGLTGKAIIVQDIRNHKGPYYTCDLSVQSEFCLPLLNDKNEVIGIIDAESFTPNFFSNEKILEISKVANDLGKNQKICLPQ